MIYDPLERFRDEFFPQFKKYTLEVYDNNVKASGVDIAANSKLCDNIYKLQESSQKARRKLNWLRLLYVLLIIVGILGALACLYTSWLNEVYMLGWDATQESLFMLFTTIVGITLLIVAFLPVRSLKNQAKESLNAIEKELSDKTTKAWEQVRPLLALFDKNTTLELIHKTVPTLCFDKFFSQDRYNELAIDFGPISFMESCDTSALGIQSGSIEGNPFALVRQKQFHMGTKTYTGHKTIYWTETVTDSDGKTRTVTRSETLTATVTKPCPYYSNNTLLVYGNDAAPNLRFIKKPSSVNNEDSMFHSVKKRSKQRKLEKFSRNLTDDSNYTMMSNTEFEVCFDTSNRNNETEFRLLFTPLAQRQMLALLKDKEVGYGDDFTFNKHDKINIISARHMHAMDLEIDTNLYASYDNRVIKRNFCSVNNEYFRGLYFAFAPLLAIPLYQQMKSQKSIWGDFGLRKSAVWEWELIANRWGEHCFAHPACVTDSILKVSHARSVDERNTVLKVTASGFSGTPKCDYISVYGGDGRFHSVRVDWIEYRPVSQSSQMQICELSEEEASQHTSKSNELLYRNIVSRLTRL